MDRRAGRLCWAAVRAARCDCVSVAAARLHRGRLDGDACALGPGGVRRRLRPADRHRQGAAEGGARPAVGLLGGHARRPRVLYPERCGHRECGAPTVVDQGESAAGTAAKVRRAGLFIKERGTLAIMD